MISKVRALGAGAWVMAVVLVAACGSNVVGQGNSSTTGTGAGGATGTTTDDATGTGGAGGCAQTPNVCCTSPEQVCCMICTDASTGTGGAGGATGTGGAGGGSAVCGGFVGQQCAPNDYCEFADHECGGNDGGGTCQPRPAGCPNNVQPTCGCDHKVYGNPCDAAAAGVDVDDLGGCTAPPGMFGCGSGFCSLDSQYCMEVPAGTSQGLTTYTCEPLPAVCGGLPGCECLSNVTCGGNCQSTSDGGLEVVCETN
jgi:hypothetical protein